MPLSKNNKEIFKQCIKLLNNGYARDLLASFESGEDMEPIDAESLFRTLMLDEGWNKEDAAKAYYAATDSIEPAS